MTPAGTPGGRVPLGARVDDEVSIAHRLVGDGGTRGQRWNTSPPIAPAGRGHPPSLERPPANRPWRASLHQVHSEHKVDAAPNYKGGFGFHPMYCFADATGETLGVPLRPGNAGANNIADHVAVLDPAVGQLPAEIAVGHRPGDDPAWCAGRSRCVPTRRGAPTSCGAAATATSASPWWPAPTPAFTPRSAASRSDDDGWPPAIRQDGDERPGAAVAELTDLVDLADWPEGTRLIVRREPLHPGAQQSLFPSPPTATGATTPTPPATPSTSTRTCEPTPMSKTTSAA